MKIDNTTKPGLKSVGGSPGANHGGRVQSGQPAPAEPAPAVALSPLATRLQEISANLAATPALDAGRVSEIKQAISDGRFNIDAGKIADGLIANVRQLLSGQRTV